MAYKSKFKGKEIDDKLDLVQKLSEDISDIKEDIKNITPEETDPVFSNSPAADITEEKKAEWDNKVDKVSGKQLSTEDFTTILKTKLEGLSNYDDTELSKALSTLRWDFNKLVSGDTTTAIKTFNEIIAFLDGIQDSQDLSSIIASIEQQITAKQDRITDLDAIRRGAEKGATAVQPEDISYVTIDVDIENADFIEDAIDAEDIGIIRSQIHNSWEELEQAVMDGKSLAIMYLNAPIFFDNVWVEDVVYCRFTHPITNILYNVEITDGSILFYKSIKITEYGIVSRTLQCLNENGGLIDVGPELSSKQNVIKDLQTIREGAARGATALQSSDVDSEVSETSTNPVQNKVIAGALTEIVGMLDTALSSVGERFDSKQDNLVSGENIKTINGESILGSGNISIEGVDNVYIADFTLRNMTATADTTIDFASLRSAMREGKVILVSSGLDSYMVATTRYIPGVGRNPNKIYISVTDGISIYTSTAISNPASIKSSENFKSTIATSEYESNIEDKTLAMPNAVGGIAKGTTIEALEGKTYNEMFDDLLFPTVNPTFTAPSASIAFKSYSPTQEAGATGPTSSNFTTGYSAGEIKLNGVKQANRGGAHDTANSFIYVNGSTSNKTLPAKVTLGSTTFKYRAAFAEGPQPKNNKGGDYSSPLASGTVDSSAITLNGTYPWYASTSSATSANPVIKQSLVAWNTTAGNMSTGQFTVQPSGTLPQVFKLPRKLHTLQLKNALNGQMETVSDVSKDYTESTETINIGGTNVTYYVYTYKGSTRGSVTLLAKF